MAITTLSEYYETLGRGIELMLETAPRKLAQIAPELRAFSLIDNDKRDCVSMLLTDYRVRIINGRLTRHELKHELAEIGVTFPGEIPILNKPGV